MLNQRKILTLTLAVSFCLAAYQAIADGRNESRAHKNIEAPAENSRTGVINRIDLENGLLIIDDITFSFSPRQLIVYRAGHISSMSSLRPDQPVRYSNTSRLPHNSNSNISAGRVNRVISKIWIE